MASSLADQLRDQSGTYLPRLIAIFFCVFDPTAGPKIVCQVPEGTVATALSTFPSSTPAFSQQPSRSDSTSSATSSLAEGEVQQQQRRPTPPPARGTTDAVVRQTPHDLSSNTQVLFEFSSVSDFVIPKQELCGHLITKATRNSKILGFPIWIEDANKYGQKGERYNRNAFIFNVCFVFERDAELSGFEPLVRKTGRFLRIMEENISLLSSPPPDFSMANVIEQIFLDLNAYSESSVLVHDTQLDLWPMPFHVNPREIHNWDVPLAVCDLAGMRTASWDVTLSKVCAFVNGVNHVRRIAELAEADQQLVRSCIQHLLYYGAVILVDLFQFTNSYAVLPAIADVVPLFAADDDAHKEAAVDLAQECEAYVYSGTGEQARVPLATLLELYTHLKPGVSVSGWMDTHAVDSLPIDPRRMIQYGIIKGFLRRVHAYPVWLDHPKLGDSRSGSDDSLTKLGDRAQRGVGLADGSTTETSALTTPRPQTPRDAPAAPQERTAVTAAAAALEENAYPHRGEDGAARQRPALGARGHSNATEPSAPPWPRSLPLMFDGSHHTDEICLKYGISIKTLELVLSTLGGGNEREASAERREERRRDHGPTTAGEAAADASRRGSVTDFGPRMSILYI